MEPTWMFQATPDYKLTVEVAANLGKSVDWHPKQYLKQMKPGHRVVLWQSGDDAGIYALGRIADVPYKPHRKWLVDITYTRHLKRPISATKLEKHPTLRQLLILRMPHGKNPYSVRDEEWTALKGLLGQKAFGQGKLPELEKVRDQEEREGEFRVPADSEDARRRKLAEIVIRQGRGQFRDALLKAYGYRCAITGYDAVDALEAAHIVPYRGPDTDHVSNGLLLRADIHTLFDLNLIAVHPHDYRIVVSNRLADTRYKKLSKKRLRLPVDEASHPSRQALERAFKNFEQKAAVL